MGWRPCAKCLNAGNSARERHLFRPLRCILARGGVTFDAANGKASEDDYYPFGLNMHRQTNTTNKNNYLYNKKELQTETTEYDYGARFYDPVIGRLNTIDPLAEKDRRWSSYSYGHNNPITHIDVDGMVDWVKDQKGNISWDKNARSQTTTKVGDTYLGKTLTFNFISYIDKKTWDGPTLGGLISPAGVKLNSTITLTGRENASGELISVVGSSFSHPGETPMGTPRDYYPGAGGSNNVFDLKTTSTGINVNFEHHTSVSPGEELGLHVMGYNVVDVAQKLNININNTGNLSISSYTDVFPSATLSVNGSQIMQYNQPSFVDTHTAPIVGTSSPTSESQPVHDFSYYPSQFYIR